MRSRAARYRLYRNAAMSCFPDGASATSTAATILGASLKSWWDFSDASSLFQLSNGTTAVAADADPIGYATDKATAGAHVTQATAGKRATYKTGIQNGLSVARFTSAGQQQLFVTGVSIVTAQPLTIFAVLSATDTNSTVMFDGGSSGHRCAMAHGVGAAGQTEMFGGTAVVGAANTMGAFHVYEFTFNGASSEILIDGVSLATGDTGANTLDDGFRINGDITPASWANEDVGEIVVASGSLSAGLRTSMRAMLKSKWGTP